MARSGRKLLILGLAAAGLIGVVLEVTANVFGIPGAA